MVFQSFESFTLVNVNPHTPKFINLKPSISFFYNSFCSIFNEVFFSLPTKFLGNKDSCIDSSFASWQFRFFFFKLKIGNKNSAKKLYLETT